jgi:methionyl-tRNA formyltransferase
VKIEFITQDDSRYILPFFEEFLQKYASEFEITQVSLCRAMGKRSRWQLFRELFWLYGLFGFARLTTSTVVDRILATLPSRRDAKRFHSIAQLCRAYGVRCGPIGSPNEAGFVSQVRERAPDVLVSVACPYILKEALLSLPPNGCVNIHHAPLPRYKGMMPTFWQMYHREKTAGLTIHYMAAKVDEGDMLLQDQLDIAPGESLDSLIRRSKRHGAHCMAQVLRAMATGTHKAVAMDMAEGSYFSFPTREQIREFRRRGLRAL